MHSIEVGIITETGLKHGTFEEQQLKNNTSAGSSLPVSSENHMRPRVRGGLAQVRASHTFAPCSVSISSTEVLSPSEHASLLQRSEILEESEQGRNRCYTLKSVKKIMKKVKAPATRTISRGCCLRRYTFNLCLFL